MRSAQRLKCVEMLLTSAAAIRFDLPAPLPKPPDFLQSRDLVALKGRVTATNDRTPACCPHQARSSCSPRCAPPTIRAAAWPTNMRHAPS